MIKFKTRKVAPKKLSAAIILAVEDLIAVECDKDYDVSMACWHTPTGSEDLESSVCHVCFAGAVMSVTLQVPWDERFSPYEFDEKWRSVFSSLDAARTGNILRAAHRMDGEYRNLDWIRDFARRNDLEVNYHNGSIIIPYYHLEADGFKIVMLKIAKALKEEGL